MYLAFDDTDSRDGMCTTYLMARFLSETGYSIVGFPRLVRLNPNIRYKTRGNGALCVRIGTRGRGDQMKIGTFRGRDIVSYEDADEMHDTEKVAGEVLGLMDALARYDDPNTNPGVVISRTPFPPWIYSEALTREISMEEAEEFLREQNATWIKRKNGRGIIGSAAAISWPMHSTTYECISYRQSGKVLDHSIKMEAAEYADSIPGTFNSVDRDNRYPAIFPKEKTPVMYGIRSTGYEGLLEASETLDSMFGIRNEGKIIYVTNQGTDDHIIPDPQVLRDIGSYMVEGRVSQNPEVIVGGHYFTSVRSHGFEVKIAAFEPTKSFRRTFSRLRCGDLVRVYGSYVDGAIHVEKMQVLEVSRHFSRVMPYCSECGAQARSRGDSDFRCPSCGKKMKYADYREIPRELSAGFYDVPVMARRHLSKPFDLERGMEVLVQ